jgi:hypothetical protein
MTPEEIDRVSWPSWTDWGFLLGGAVVSAVAASILPDWAGGIAYGTGIFVGLHNGRGQVIRAARLIFSEKGEPR